MVFVMNVLLMLFVKQDNTLPKGALIVILASGFSVLMDRETINIRFVHVKLEA